MVIFQKNKFEFQRLYILTHVLDGEIKKGKCFGVHFYQKEKHVIEELTLPPNKYGIWEAIVKIKHPTTSAWVKKEKASTFFPKNWTQEILIQKLKEAYNNRIKKQSYKHIGTTSCGIKVVFIFQNNIVSSCFPLI